MGSEMCIRDSYKKTTNSAAIWGVVSSIPIAMYFKVGPKGWIDSPLFVNEPFMNQMMWTCLATIGIIYLLSNLTSLQEDPKAIQLTKGLFKTNADFNIPAFAVCIITAFLYAFFW